MEIVTAEDQTRLDVGELRGTSDQLNAARGVSLYSEAVFIIDKDDDERSATMGAEVEVDTYGADESAKVFCAN